MSDTQVKPTVLFKGFTVVGSFLTRIRLMNLAAMMRRDCLGPPSQHEALFVWEAETADGGPSLQAKYVGFLEDHSFVAVNLECEAEVHELLLDIMAMS